MKGVLIVNLGTPDKPEKQEVKSYLGEFLMDKYVIDMSYLGRLLLVKGIILNTRPEKSAAAYKRIWTEDGSPLMIYTEALVDQIKKRVDVPVEMGMRYNKPSINTALKALKNKGCDEVFVVSLYPQYAMSTTLTVEEKVMEEAKKIDPEMKVEFLAPFYNHPEYIEVLAEKVKAQMQAENGDYLLFSYHGIPVRHLIKTDCTAKHCMQVKNCCEVPSEAHSVCYRHQCLETTKAVAKYLGLNKDQYETSFQSRLGRAQWLTPYTAERLEALPKEGKKNIAVVTPSFLTDCLETLEEIGMEGKESFEENGGEAFKMISCLNADDQWADVLAKWINEKV